MAGFHHDRLPQHLQCWQREDLHPIFLFSRSIIQRNPPATEITIELYGFLTSMYGSWQYSQSFFMKIKTVMGYRGKQ